MTGKIFEVVGRNKTYCRIRGEDGNVYFAHREVFADPSIMEENREVQFNPKPFHPVTDVVALTHSTNSIR
jgi:hypothetical protein